MFTTFFDWLSRSVQNALNILSTIYQNSIMAPFFNLLLVIVALGVIIKFILSPLLGTSLAGASDKVKDKAKDNVSFIKNAKDAGDYF